MAKGLKAKTGHIFILTALLACVLFSFAQLGRAAEEQPAAPPAQGAVQTPAGGAAMDCRQLAEQLQQQKNMLTRELGQIKREIAALREDMGSPGIKEVFAGIGYIFGLAGVGLYVSNRRRKQT